MDAKGERAAPVLSVKQVVKTFGEKRAVNGVSLEVMPGDIFGFVGHNGAGKTTLIRAIVGVAGFDEGDIRVVGQSVRTDALACKRVCAYVPDNPDVYEFLTGIQYLNYISDVFEVPADTRRERIRAHADRLGLTSALGDLVSSYSHGMRQKLVLIGALVHDPALLVLDEPFVGLDPEASFHVKEMLRELAGRGSAVFFSSHVLEVVEKLCNKVAIIKQGELRACGPTSEVVGDESLEDVFLDMIERDVQGARGADGMRGIDDAHRAQGSQGAHGVGEPREGREVDAARASRSAQTGRTGCGRRS
ncbi:ABC-type transporter ATP-binding protein EcsA [Coriobacteriaceae bacterium CHKCI002]|nr:ABC-type transporter ATP-binding protein EcsA [Coriobacteriaceae bacterium CHKCI002]